MKVPIIKPYFGDEEKKAVIDTLESGWLVQGPRVAEFERMVCEYTGARFAKATTSLKPLGPPPPKGFPPVRAEFLLDSCIVLWYTSL